MNPLVCVPSSQPIPYALLAFMRWRERVALRRAFSRESHPAARYGTIQFGIGQHDKKPPRTDLYSVELAPKVRNPGNASRHHILRRLTTNLQTAVETFPYNQEFCASSNSEFGGKRTGYRLTVLDLSRFSVRLSQLVRGRT